MQRRCCSAAVAAAVPLLLFFLHAFGVAFDASAGSLSSSGIQADERCHKQLLLQQNQGFIAFFISVLAPPLCTKRHIYEGRHHGLLGKKPYIRTFPSTAMTSATLQSRVNRARSPTAASLETGKRRTAKHTAVAARRPAKRAFLLVEHLTAAAPRFLAPTAKTPGATTRAAAPLTAAPSFTGRLHDEKACFSVVGETKGKELLGRYAAANNTPGTTDTAVLGAVGDWSAASAGDAPPESSAAPHGGQHPRGHPTSKDEMKDCSAMISSATCFAVSQRQTPVAVRAAADLAKATAALKEELQQQEHLVMNKSHPVAADDAAAKPLYSISTCGVPVGSATALQEYARRLGISLLRTKEVGAGSASHAAEYSEQEDHRPVVPQDCPEGTAEQHQQEPEKHQQTRGLEEAGGERGHEQRQHQGSPWQQHQKQRESVSMKWWGEEPQSEQRRWRPQQQPRKRRLVVLGSTGSIGRSTLQVVEAFPERFEVVGLAAAGTNLPLLLQQIIRHRPRYVAVGNAETATELRKLLLTAAVSPQAAAAAAAPRTADARSPAAAASPFLAPDTAGASAQSTANATTLTDDSAVDAATIPVAATMPPPAAAAISTFPSTTLTSAAPAAAATLSASAITTPSVRPSPSVACGPASLAPSFSAPANVQPVATAGCCLPQIYYGDEGLVELAALDTYDVLVSAIVGFAGLQPTLKALTTGKDVALANKEALVAAGGVFRSLYAPRSGAPYWRRRRLEACGRVGRASVSTPLGDQGIAGERACATGMTSTGTDVEPSPISSVIASSRLTSTSSTSSHCPALYPSSAESLQQKERLGLLLPVDSEHSAIFQALQGVAPTNYPPKRLLLVATGGPFRGWKKAALQHVTVEQVLRHPRWNMGAKISVDSATLMNKGLEVIEAHYAFGCPYSTIEVLVHPQAVVHSAVELCDGAVLAQLGTADMKLPIAYALTWPERLNTPWPRLDLLQEGSLTFEKPDMDTFGCLRAAYEAGMRGGLAPACLNAANEIAVSRLLEKKLSFLQIEDLVQHVLRVYDSYEGKRTASDVVSLQDVLEADAWARRVAREWKNKV